MPIAYCAPLQNRELRASLRQRGKEILPSPWTPTSNLQILHSRMAIPACNPLFNMAQKGRCNVNKAIRLSVSALGLAGALAWWGCHSSTTAASKPSLKISQIDLGKAIQVTLPQPKSILSRLAFAPLTARPDGCYAFPATGQLQPPPMLTD